MQEPAPNWTVHITISSSSSPQADWKWTVDPYALTIEQGQTVRWEVDWNGCDREPFIIVHPKKKGSWPFVGAQHQGPNQADSGPMKANAGGHYAYGIVVVCPGQGAVVIDPDMDVLG